MSGYERYLEGTGNVLDAMGRKAKRKRVSKPIIQLSGLQHHSLRYQTPPSWRDEVMSSRREMLSFRSL